MAKEYKDHIMGKGKARVMTNNLEGHEALEKLGWGHPPFKMAGYPVHYGTSPMAFKGANSENSKCWKGCRKVGTKPSPTRPGVTVNDCDCG